MSRPPCINTLRLQQHVTAVIMEPLKTALDNWSPAETDPKAWNDLILSSADSMARHQWGNTILCHAARVGCLPFIKQLFLILAGNETLRREILLDSPRSFPAHQSVGEAAAHGHVELVRFLISQEGINKHLTYFDSRHNSVLHKAADPTSCHPEIFKMLIEKVPISVYQVNADDKTPLDLLIDTHSDHNPIVLACARVLISRGKASVAEGHAERAKLPLPRAAMNCDVAMCHVLLQEGPAKLNDIFHVVNDKLKFIDEDKLVRKIGEERVEEMLTAICKYNM